MKKSLGILSLDLLSYNIVSDRFAHFRVTVSQRGILKILLNSVGRLVRVFGHLNIALIAVNIYIY